ncbi:MAG: hypothetical protein LBM94_04375 [Propionibacteriaceae bacterium]|jgi:hypothetical protein|nr:hypothetical protein [Propionibacteriaceae bacterium]
MDATKLMGVEAPPRYWVVLETGSNQDFVFESIRQRFTVGASALLKRLPLWVEAAKEQTTGVSIVVNTSGKALLLVSDRAVGRSIVHDVTKRALVEAPGLDLWGYVEDDDDVTAGGKDPMGRLGRLHAHHAAVRYQRVSPLARFPMHPFLESCVTTGRPAVDLGTDGASSAAPSSALALAARSQAGDAIAAIQQESGYGSAVVRALDKEITNGGWVAVIHADGNGIGDVITKISRQDELVNFSKALESATTGALQDAVTGIQTLLDADGKGETRKDWLFPLIIGGDDVTLLCDGRLALDLVRKYLVSFEHRTASDTNSHMAPTLDKCGLDHLSASAGIAFVKPHFPYHAACELAEELARNAKDVKNQDAPINRRSSYDFHVLHDSVIAPLSTIRERLDGANGAFLWPGPFLVSEPDRELQEGWETAHDDGWLVSGIAELAGPRDEQVLSQTSLHELREAILVDALKQPVAGSGFVVGAATGRARSKIAAHSRSPRSLAKMNELLTPHGDGTAIGLLAVLDLADIAAGVSAGQRAEGGNQK